MSPKTRIRSAHGGSIVKSETSELNKNTGELNRNTNVNKMSYLAPAGTCTGAQAGRCAIGECALADAAPLLAVAAVPPDICSCGRACSFHMRCHGHVQAQAAQLRCTPLGWAVWPAPVGGRPLPR